MFILLRLIKAPVCVMASGIQPKTSSNLSALDVSEESKSRLNFTRNSSFRFLRTMF